jgi:hypothetical protein
MWFGAIDYPTGGLNMIETINVKKVLCVIREIESVVLAHSTAHFWDSSLEDILSEYGIYELFNAGERKLVGDHLYQLVLQDEFSEAARLVEEGMEIMI